MIIKRSREHTVNLGNYENVKIGAEVTLDEDDIKLFDEDDGAVASANRLLDNLLADDLKEAELNVPADKETHLTTWKQ